MSSTLPLGAKPPDYYGLQREDVVSKLEPPLGRVLDVGCGEGGADELLRVAGATWVSGIEVLPEPAARAAERYDEVAVGDALEALERVTGPFDTILCYDVLEHLIDPGTVLRALHRVSSPGARLHVSIPNARHVSLLRDLFLKGTFGYVEYGHRDATHLRWFTRRDIESLLSESGWRVESTTPSALNLSRPLHRLTRGRTSEFLAGQWHVLARR